MATPSYHLRASVGASEPRPGQFQILTTENAGGTERVRKERVRADPEPSILWASVLSVVKKMA